MVASRLSENPNWRILLIEYGEDPSLLSDIPGLVLLLQGSPEDYDYKVEPNSYSCLGMKNKQCLWPKGKALGGSSVINAMLYIRGVKDDFDEWKRQGNDGWGYEDVLPYFLKIENYHPDVVSRYGKDKLGTGGPLVLRPFNYTLSWHDDLIFNAAKELKIPIMDMINVNDYHGFGKAYGNLDNGIRQNIAKAYLNPIRDRKNLYVIKSARVDSVIVNDDKKKATGVEVKLKDGSKVEIKSSKEVILAAGSIGSPQILMLSGIGDKNELKKHNVKTITDLPAVGKHLQNHLVWAGIHLTYVNKTHKPIDPKLFMLDYTYEYLLHRKGEFASTGGLDMVGFFNTKDPKAKRPNLQFHLIHIAQNQAFKVVAVARAFSFGDDLIHDLIQSNVDSDILLVGPTLLHPKTNAQLKLKSKNPEDQIEIHADYFDNQDDIDVMFEGLEIVRKLLKTKPFRDLDVKLRRFNIQACNEYTTDSREYWECNLRHTTSTVYHPTGSCRFGTNDENSVVNSELKVHGIDGLRVIDASVMPEITSGNTHSPTLMIAEKASDMIKNYWSTKDEL